MSGFATRREERHAADGGRAGPAIAYRPPGAAQRAEIDEIVRETGVFRPQEVAVALEVFDDYCAAPGVDYRAIGAYVGDRLVGFAFYGSTPCTVNTWDLYWIAVRPSAQGAGAGRGLLERAERDMRADGGRLCVIETSGRVDYSASRGFYVACGYSEAARVPGFYEDGDDRVTYVKKLQ